MIDLVETGAEAETPAERKQFEVERLLQGFAVGVLRCIEAVHVRDREGEVFAGE